MTTTTRGRYAASDPVPRWAKMMMLLTIAALVVAIAVACGADTASTATEPEPTEEPTETVEPETATPEPEPEPEPALPEPDGEVSAFCDSSLDSDKDLRADGRYKFLASLDATNTGNVDIDVEVWVEFNQLGAEPLRYTEEVAVPVGETVAVYVDETVSRDEWRRFMDAGAKCNIGINLVDFSFEVAE